MNTEPTLKVDDQITVRRAVVIADYFSCQEAQRKAWGISDDGYLVPIATMVGANLHGGLVLGAFLPDGEAVAMSFAFLGRVEGRLCLYSQLTGVVPGYQSRGLGHAIKRHQRTIAYAEGIERIAWAFDPLQAGNAHFNLARLKASAGRYVENMYGPRTDALNAGVPTDRLIVEWETGGEDATAVTPMPDAANLPQLIVAEQGSARHCPASQFESMSGRSSAASSARNSPATLSTCVAHCPRSPNNGARLWARPFRPLSPRASGPSTSSAMNHRAGAEAFTCSNGYNLASAGKILTRSVSEARIAW